MIHVVEPAAAVDKELLAGEGTPRTQSETVLAEEKMQALADASRDGRLKITSGIRRGVATHEIVKAAEELDQIGNGGVSKDFLLTFGSLVEPLG